MDAKTRRIASRRSDPQIARLFALIVDDPSGQESVLRRDTPYGTQPWITDDPGLIETMLALATEEVGPRVGPIRIATFARIEP